MRKALTAIVLAAVPLLALLTIGEVEAPVGVSASVSPLTTRVSNRGPFSVNVIAANVTDFYGFEFTLYYNTTSLDGVDVRVGPFLGSDGWSQIFTSRLEINDTIGRVLVAASRYAAFNGVSGTGTIATVDFSANPNGYSLLDLRGVKFSNSAGNPIGDANLDREVDTVMDGYATTVRANIPPVVDFNTYPAYPAPQQSISFDASTSYDPDGTITGYSWKFGDLTTGSGLLVQHSYAVRGLYNVTLTATDNNGTDTSAWKLLQVEIPEIAVTSMSADAQEAAVGDQLLVYVTVGNLGNGTQSFEVTAYANNLLIGRTSVVALASQASQQVTFPWDTSGRGAGTYMLVANETILMGEPNTTNNSVQGGQVVLKNRSSLSLNAHPSATDVEMSGYLTPTIQGARITLETSEGSGGWTVLAVVATDSTGYYNYVWQSPGAGQHQIRAVWQGDSTTLGSTSPSVPVDVTGEVLNTAAYGAAILGALGATIVAAYVLSRRRKKTGNWFRSVKLRFRKHSRA